MSHKRFILPLHVLSHRNYRLFFFGQSISLIGTWMQTVAQQWLVYRLTHSTIHLGVVGFLGQVPILLLAPFGGALADRFQKRNLLLITQSLFLLHALIIASLTFTSLIRFWHIAVLAFFFGLVNALDVPTRQAFVSELVPTELLANAIALNSAVFNAARVIGPAIGGAIVAVAGEEWCFLMNAVSYLAVIFGLLLIKVHSTLIKSDAPLLKYLTDGIAYIISASPIRDALMLLCLVSLTGMSYVVLMPVFADRILRAGPKGMGMLMASAGFGAFFGAVLLAMLRSNKAILSKRIVVGSVGFGTSLCLFSQSRQFLLSAFMLAVAGFFMVMQMTSSNAFVQTTSPSNMRGRVMAVYAMMFMGMAPFGSLLAGTLAHILSAQMAVAFGGLSCLIGGLLFAHHMPKSKMAQ
jgi:MFS family permease